MNSALALGLHSTAQLARKRGESRMRRAENSQLVAPREGDPQLRSTRTCCACTAASLQLQELEELGLLPAQSPTSTLPKMVAAVLGTPSCRSSRPTGRGCCCLDRWNDSQLDWQVRAHASVSGVSRNRFNQRCGQTETDYEHAGGAIADSLAKITCAFGRRASIIVPEGCFANSIRMH